jgi:hypothetical protein
MFAQAYTRISCRAPLALMYFMRLSLMKAAQASVGGASCRKSGTMGRKRRGEAPPKPLTQAQATIHKNLLGFLLLNALKEGQT